MPQPEVEIRYDDGMSTLLINGQAMGHFGGYAVKADPDDVLSVTVTLYPSKLTVGHCSDSEASDS